MILWLCFGLSVSRGVMVQNIVLWLLGVRKLKTTFTRPVYIYGLRPLGRKTYLYAGQSVQEIEIRILTHLTDAKHGRHKNKALQAAILRYNFMITYDVLEICSEENADERESYWIKELSKKKPTLNIRDPKTRFRNL